MKMKPLFLLSLAFALLFIGCGNDEMRMGYYQYTFNVEGDAYRIISASNTGNGMFNLLVREDDSRMLLRAVDFEQDGILDSVLVGDMPLDQANRIYTRGIRHAETKGNLSKKKLSRVFHVQGASRNYRIQTIFKMPQEAYNRFSVLSVTDVELDVVLDRDADGQLDEIVNGREKLDAYQTKYQMTLARGIRTGDIVYEDKIYQVVQ